MNKQTENIMHFAKDWGLLAVVSFFLAATYGDFQQLGKSVQNISTTLAVVAQKVMSQEERMIKHDEHDREQDKKINQIDLNVSILKEQFHTHLKNKD